MKNWKTTLFGILTSIGASCILSEDPVVKMIGTVISIIGPSVLGAVAKDAGVTGTGQ